MSWTTTQYVVPGTGLNGAATEALLDAIDAIDSGQMHTEPRGTNKKDNIDPYSHVTNGDMAVPTEQLGYKYKR